MKFPLHLFLESIVKADTGIFFSTPQSPKIHPYQRFRPLKMIMTVSSVLRGVMTRSKSQEIEFLSIFGAIFEALFGDLSPRT